MRRAGIWLGPILLLLLCAQCARKEAHQGKTRIRFSFWGSFVELQLWERMKELHEKRHPDVVVDLQYSPGEYHRKLRLQFISKTACDVIMVDDEFFPTYCAANHLFDLEPFIREQNDRLRLDDFLPTSIESFTYNGTRYAMPWDGFSMLVFYNKDLFDREGLPYPEDEWTWEQFRELSRALTKDLDGDGRTDQFGCNLGFDWLSVEPLIWSYGGRILTEDRSRCAMNSPETIAALQFIYDLKFEDKVMPGTGELSGMATEIQILTGRIAMLQAAAYILNNMRDVEAMRWDIVHMPSGPAGKATRVSWDGLAVYANSDHPREAWRFIETVLSDEGQELVGSLQRAMPVRRSAVLAHYVTEDTPQEEKKFLEAMEYGRPTPITEAYGEMQIVMANELERLSLGNTTPRETVEALQRKVDEILAEKHKETGGRGRDKSGASR